MELRRVNEELTVQIEERRRAEEMIFRLNRLYEVLSKVNEAIVRIHTPDELYERICRIAVETGAFAMAWVGLTDPVTKRIEPVVKYGDSRGYLTGVKIYADDVPEGRGPTGKAALKGSYSICSDIENDPDMLPWRDKAISHGFRSSAAFPFRAGSGITGVLTLYSNNPRFLAEEEIHLISSLAEDISFALDVMASEKRRLEAEDELRMLNEELEQRVAARTSDLETANKELESFSYSVSHDLQAPLRHISGFSELLQKNLGERHDKKIIHYASVISEAAKKMAVLIDDLLKFSQIGRAGMRMDRVDLNALVKVVIAEIMEHEKLRRIKWKTAKMPEVMADASMLRLVFVNLVSNAVKFSRSRKVAEIDIGCEEGFGEYVFHIRDNGVGFDMNYADKLFGVFQRLHHADEFEGTGIGLANVRRIVSRHGGRTWAESEAGEGAVFYFSLPRDRGI
jgi:signal transduction histidine kinase